MSITNTEQGDLEMFSFGLDGCIQWAPRYRHSGDVRSIWSVDTELTPEIDVAANWVSSEELSPLALSPSQFSTSYVDGALRAQKDDLRHQTTVLDSDPNTLKAKTRKARRQAQNRQAQRAYRARKEKELQKSRIEVRDLEQELQRWRGAVSPAQVAILQGQVVALETTNKALQDEVEGLREYLSRVANVLNEFGMDKVSARLVVQ